MSRCPHVVRRRNAVNRRRKERRQAKREALVGAYNPVTGQIAPEPAKPALSQTQEKKIDRQDRFVKERAERKLRIMDKRWGIGLGPIKKRFQWMRDLFGE